MSKRGPYQSNLCLNNLRRPHRARCRNNVLIAVIRLTEAYLSKYRLIYIWVQKRSAIRAVIVSGGRALLPHSLMRAPTRDPESFNVDCMGATKNPPMRGIDGF